MAETTTDTMTERETMGSEGVKWLSGLTALLGAWLAISPFVIETTMTDASMWNNIIIGAAIFLIAGYNYYRMSKGMAVSMGGAALVGLLGLWMVVSPFVAFEVEGATMLWSNVVTGALVALIAGYNTYAGREERTVSTARTT